MDVPLQKTKRLEEELDELKLDRRFTDPGMMLSTPFNRSETGVKASTDEYVLSMVCTSLRAFSSFSSVVCTHDQQLMSKHYNYRKLSFGIADMICQALLAYGVIYIAVSVKNF